MREFVRQRLQDWRNEIPGPWVETFHQTLANFDAVDPGVPAPQHVFPGLRGNNPNATHYLLRAFDALAPADVRVIVIGQDPYPDQDRATGRAFEDGASADVAGTTSPSLRRIAQSAVSLCTNRADLAENAAGWNVLLDEFELPRTSAMFDGLSAQGVLCINAAWTFSGSERVHLDAHLRIWRPVLRSIIRRLLADNGNRVVLALGAKSHKIFGATGPNPAHFVQHCHPQARKNAWFAQPNPFAEVNRILTEINQAPICWLPGLACKWPPHPN